MMEINEILNWRYATKKMTGAKVPQNKIDIIVKSVQLAPTSVGFQAFHLYVIEDEALRQTIFEKSCQQTQVVEGSHLLVFAARTEITDAEVDNYMNLVATTRNIPVESLNGYKGMVASFKQKTEQEYFDWTARQAYIAFSFALVAAAVENVDATPIEGFSPPVMDEILGLKEKGLKSVVLIALGYRDEANDKLAHAPKVRKPISELVTVI
ncbi:MAG: nitroreductase family protein [Bacteroidales bacterium]|nr:nitroreductase family protein [Bacteroidales bacterium]